MPNLSGILSDLNLRKAILYAIDYNTLISNVYLDMAQQCEVPCLRAPGSMKAVPPCIITALNGPCSI